MNNPSIDGNRRVLIIPDAWNGDASGALVARELCRHLQNLDFKVGVCCRNIAKTETDAYVDLFHVSNYRIWSNIYDTKLKSEFSLILDDFKPTHLYFIGSITNKPLCYLEEGLKRGLHINVFIFMQDFFCYKYYANNNEGPCQKCLEKGFSQSVWQQCGIHRQCDVVKQLLGIYTRKKLQKILKQVNWVITSSEEQILSYLKYGISKNRIMKIPLFFDCDRVLKEEIDIGNYYIGIAQNRIEKGFHLLPRILENLEPNIKVLLAYYNEEEAKIAIKDNGFNEYIAKGILEVKGNLTWSNGLGKAIARSRGVIIPSIWPSTTEFGLLEALGMGKPVFTYSVGIHPEILVNGENGYTFNLDDNKGFAAALSNMTDKDYQRVSQGAKDLFDRLTDEKLWQQLITTSM